MDAIDLSISVLSDFSKVPDGGSFFSKTEMYATLVDSKIDSNTEHKNEIVITRTNNRIKISILSYFFVNINSASGERPSSSPK